MLAVLSSSSPSFCPLSSRAMRARVKSPMTPPAAPLTPSIPPDPGMCWARLREAFPAVASPTAKEKYKQRGVRGCGPRCHLTADGTCGGLCSLYFHICNAAIPPAFLLVRGSCCHEGITDRATEKSALSSCCPLFFFVIKINLLCILDDQGRQSHVLIYGRKRRITYKAPLCQKLVHFLQKAL